MDALPLAISYITATNPQVSNPAIFINLYPQIFQKASSSTILMAGKTSVAVLLKNIIL